MTRIALWYVGLPKRLQMIGRSVLVAVVTYATALLGGVVAKSLEIEGFGAFAFVTVAVFAIVIVGILCASFAMESVNQVGRERTRRSQILSSAYSFADKWLLDEIRMLSELRVASPDRLVLAPANPHDAMRRLVSSAHDALNTHYGRTGAVDEEIDFEVTFMTRSYGDGEVTIAAWANKDGRRPVSMRQRADDCKVYNGTVTADVYRAAKPDMRIIEDTNIDDSYAEVYANQKKRIRSSIVYPVLSSDNALLGTMVLHCDCANFFRKEDAKFWRQFCEVFTKKLALEKLLLDHAWDQGSPDELGAGSWATPPF